MSPVKITRPTSPSFRPVLPSIDSCNIISSNINFCKLFFYPTSSLILFLSSPPSSSIHTDVRACMHTYIHSHIHTYIHTHTHTYIHAYIHTYIHTYIHIHTYILSCCCNIYKASDCGAKTQLKQKQNFTDGWSVNKWLALRAGAWVLSLSFSLAFRGMGVSMATNSLLPSFSLWYIM